VSFPLVPRDYQSKALDDLGAAWIRVNASGRAPRLLLVSRTGTGKTVISGMFLQRVLAKGRRAGFIVRDRTLLDQTSKHLDAIGLSQHGVIAAGHKRSRPDLPLQVCMAQTLTARGDAPDFDVLVFDEAESILCSTSKAIADAYPRATFLGLTATPERSDGQPMGDVFHELVQVEATFEQLVALGALVPFDIVAGPSATTTLSMHPLEALRKHAPRLEGHKAVTFAVSVKRALELAEQAASFGYRAAAVHGKTKAKDLREAFERFELPERDPRAIDALFNCDLLIRGWDCPPADVGILEQGCTAWGPFVQKVGRFLRPSPATGKRRATFVDLRGSVWVCGHPAVDRVFSLTESETQRNAKADAAPLSSCRSCGNVFLSGPQRCPRCGHVAPPPPAPRVKAEPMAIIGKQIPRESMSTMHKAWLAMEAEGRAKGRKPMAAALRFLGRFRFFPPWFKHGGGARKSA
jgi:superfamily II DNA or RNA helicase